MRLFGRLWPLYELWLALSTRGARAVDLLAPAGFGPRERAAAFSAIDTASAEVRTLPGAPHSGKITRSCFVAALQKGWRMCMPMAPLPPSFYDFLLLDARSPSTASPCACVALCHCAVAQATSSHDRQQLLAEARRSAGGVAGVSAVLRLQLLLDPRDTAADVAPHLMVSARLRACLEVYLHICIIVYIFS